MSLNPAYSSATTRSTFSHPFLLEPAYGDQGVTTQTLKKVHESINTIGLDFLCELCRDKLENGATNNAISSRIRQEGFNSQMTSDWFASLSKGSLRMIKTMLDALREKMPDILNSLEQPSHSGSEEITIVHFDRFLITAKNGDLYLYGDNFDGKPSLWGGELLMPVAQVLTQYSPGAGFKVEPPSAQHLINVGLTEENLNTADLKETVTLTLNLPGALGQIMPQNVKPVRKNTFTDVQTTASEDLVYLEQAANAGNVGALYTLGIAYRDGSGVKKNINKALEFFKKAAEKNHIESTFAYAELLLEQHPRTPWSYASYKAWIIHSYTFAAIKGHTESAYKLAQLHEQEETKEGYRLAYKYYSLANRNGHKEAAEQISVHIPAKAQKMFDQAKQLWATKSFFNSNESKAICLYEKAAQFHHQEAAFIMAEIHVIRSKEFTISLAPAHESPKYINHREAWDYYDIAGDYKQGLAMFKCAQMWGKRPNAVNYYQKAVTAGYPGAQHMLTLTNLYLNASKRDASADEQYAYACALWNEGSPSSSSDRTEVKEFFQRAAKQGHEKAKEMLKEMSSGEKSFGIYATSNTTPQKASSTYDEL